MAIPAVSIQSDVLNINIKLTKSAPMRILIIGFTVMDIRAMGLWIRARNHIICIRLKKPEV
jgi:hypothetical protein